MLDYYNSMQLKGHYFIYHFSSLHSVDIMGLKHKHYAEDYTLVSFPVSQFK